METNTILLIVAGILLGAIIGFIVAKVLEKNKASKLIREAKRSAGKILKEAKSFCTTNFTKYSFTSGICW